MISIRQARRMDIGFLTAMLAEAASWDRPAGAAPPAPAEIVCEPQVADYVEDWGREGDTGVVAEWDGEPVGACWFRRFTSAHPGYGFLGENAPGLGLAVRPAFRGRGVGTRLLAAAIDLARRRGVDALSLSVAEVNPARRLYERAGFEKVGREGESLTMRLRLTDERPVTGESQG